MAGSWKPILPAIRMQTGSLKRSWFASEDYLTKLQQGYASGGDMPDLLMAEMGWRGSAFALDIWENLEAEPYNFDRSVLLDSVISSHY